MKYIVMARTATGTRTLAETRFPPSVCPAGLSGVELTGLWAAAPVPELPIALTQPIGDVTQLPDSGATSFRLIQLDPGSDMAMHATDTVDYMVILSGGVELEADDGSRIALTAGDCIIQLGGRHAWHNLGSSRCVIASVIVGARSVLLHE
jgi:mannose-6-phosphate isomerase-like protein (cupin superfamily)